jgi:DNA-binding response OmpR family regulator
MRTIVIIDDEFGLADVLAATLSDAGYRVFSAVNGTQGMEVMAEHQPDLVLLDYAQVPVILMSAVPESVVRRRTTDYVAFLRKPFDFDALMTAMGEALGDPPRS